MPDPNDNVVEVELDVPGHDDANSSAENNNMDPAVAAMMTQQLTQTGIIAQNNFVTVQKVVDYDYLENKRMVTLDEAIGVREVSSKQSPAGPTSV